MLVWLGSHQEICTRTSVVRSGIMFIRLVGRFVSPQVTVGLEGTTIISLATGDCQTIALDVSGRVYGWGSFKKVLKTTSEAECGSSFPLE